MELKLYIMKRFFFRRPLLNCELDNVFFSQNDVYEEAVTLATNNLNNYKKSNNKFAYENYWNKFYSYPSMFGLFAYGAIGSFSNDRHDESMIIKKHVDIDKKLLVDLIKVYEKKNIMKIKFYLNKNLMHIGDVYVFNDNESEVIIENSSFFSNLYNEYKNSFFRLEDVSLLFGISITKLEDVFYDLIDNNIIFSEYSRAPINYSFFQEDNMFSELLSLIRNYTELDLGQGESVIQEIQKILNDKFKAHSSSPLNVKLFNKQNKNISLNTGKIKILPEVINDLMLVSPNLEYQEFEELKNVFSDLFGNNSEIKLNDVIKEININHILKRLSISKENLYKKQFDSELFYYLMTNIDSLEISLDNLIFNLKKKIKHKPKFHSSDIYIEIDNELSENIYIDLKKSRKNAYSCYGKYLDDTRVCNEISKDILEFYSETEDILFVEQLINPIDRRVGNIKASNPVLKNWISTDENHTYKNKENKISFEDILVGLDYDNNLYLKYTKTNQLIIPIQTNLISWEFMNTLDRFISIVGAQFCNQVALFENDMLKNIPSLPRLTYKNIIIRKKTWIFNNVNKQFEEFKEDFFNFVTKWKVDKRVYYFSKDRKIIINVENDKELKLLHKNMKQENEICMEECFLLYDQNELITNSVVLQIKNKEFSTQIRDYQITKVPEHNEEIIRFKNWLLIDVYFQQISLDSMIKYILVNVMKEERVEFFYTVRYSKMNGNYIRIRVNEESNKSALAFKKKLIDFACIKKVNYSFHQSEVERYGGTNSAVNIVERFFIKDSEYMLNIYKRMDLTKDSKLLVGILDVMNFINMFFDALTSDRIEFIKELFNTQPPKNVFPRINSKKIYMIEDVFIYEDFDNVYMDNFIQYQKDFKIIIRDLKKESLHRSYKNVFKDIVHMHLNRLYGNEVVFFENITYISARNTLLQHIYKGEKINE